MQQGDFIEIDYTGRVKLTGEIFDLTSEDTAKKEKLYTPNAPYGPALVVVGSNMVIKGVMKELEKMQVGEELTFDVAPSEGFGLRNTGLIKIVPMSKFIENKINPVPGAYFDIDGMQAKVQSVSGGRVRIDFNNPLAGKTLTYSLRIIRKIEGDREKIEALLKYYRIAFSSVELREKAAEIKTAKPLNPLAKKIVSDMITRWVKGIEKTEFVEEEQNKKPHAEEEKKLG